MSDETPPQDGVLSAPESIATPPPSADINVVDPNGEMVSIPQEQMELATQHGYTQATPEMVASQNAQDDLQAKYGGVGQQAMAGLEGAASGVLGSTITTAAEKSLGIPAEDIRGREEAHPGTHTLGELGGFGLGAVTGVGEAGLLTKAGELAGAGLSKAGYVAKFGTDAAKAAFEGVLYEADQNLGKAFKEDPNLTASHAIADIGLAGVMTGVFGGAMGAVFRKAGLEAKVATAGEAAAAEELAPGIPKGEPATFVSGADKAAYESGDLETHVRLDPEMKPAKKEGIMEAFKIRKQKVNAKEIEAAREALGAPATPGMLLESPLIQTQVDALAHSPYTYSGNRIRTALDKSYEVAQDALKTATESSNGLSKDELGHSLQSSLTDGIREAYAPVKAAFEEVSALHPDVPVSVEDIGAFRSGLKDIKEVALGPSTDEGKLARQVVSALQNAKNADDISAIRNMSALKKSGVGADPMGRIKGILRDRLQGMQDEAVAKYARSFPRNDEAGAVMVSLIEQNKAAQQAYKPYIKKVGELSEWLGKGKIHGTEDALHFMNDRLSASDVSQRLFSASKDPAFLKFFGREFPEQAKLVRDYQRMTLRDAATTGEAFSPKVFFNKFNKLEPEVQKALYSADEIKKIGAAETFIRDAFPKNYNPSGTAHTLALREAYGTPKSMIFANARDFAMEKIVKMAEGSAQAAQAAELAKATIAGDKLATRSIKSIFSGAKDALPAALIPTAPQRDKLARLVDTYSADPSKLYGQGDSNPVPEYAQSFAATSARAVQYLAAMKPDTAPKNPLDSKLPPNPVKQAAYDRALDIAQQPLNALVRVKQGTLTNQDMLTLKTIHPDAYQSMASKMMAGVVESQRKGDPIPYQTRLQMSLFLGQPLDSTMTGANISAIQNANKAPQSRQQQESQQPGRAPSASSVKGLGKLSTEAMTQSQARTASQAKGGRH